MIRSFYFCQIRTRDPSAKGDRYMLITYDESTKSVKVGYTASII